MDTTRAIGGFAAVCTTASIFRSSSRCWETGEAGDLSLKMFLILTTGIASWVDYGVLRKDRVIITANSVSLCFYFKLREK